MKSISLLLILCSLNVFAQSTDAPVFEKVILDGKPAFINVSTGEIVDTPNGKSLKSTVSAVSTTINNPNTNTHKVTKGETLYSISKKYGITVADFKTLNSSIDINTLSIGQEIKINNKDKSIIDSTLSVAKDSISVKEYIVKKGETLYSISRKFNVLVSELKSLNNLTSNTISVGQKLIIK